MPNERPATNSLATSEAMLVVAIVLREIAEAIDWGSG
jgi:hypothetical protein